MTFEEAKKILKKEGYDVEKVGRPCSPSIVFTAYESPEICEAMQVVWSAGYGISMVSSRFDDRKARLSLELAENSAPIPGSPLSAVEGIKLKWKDNQNTSENPALKESASQFNDALLDEQAKEIESLRDKCKKYVDVLCSVRDKLRELKEENKRIKNSDLNLEGLTYATRELKEKNKEIAELTNENERLKDQVAVLYARKEYNEKYNLKQIKRLGKEISKLNSIIHDKNAVLSDVAEELRLSKIREKNLTEVSQKYMKENEELREKLAGEAKRVEMIRNASKEYCDYGVAANEFIKELASLYVLANNKGIINDEMLERCKNYQTYGFPANCNRETKKEINDIARGKTKVVGVDIAEEGGDHSAIIAQCCKNIAISKDEAEIIERCTKNGTELHYSEKDGFTYTNMFGDEIPIICLRGMYQVFTDEEIKNMKK